MNYIGCDCHIASLDCAVVNERGQETKKQKMNTGVKGLMEFVKSIPKPRKIIIEEGEGTYYFLMDVGDVDDKYEKLRFNLERRES